MISMVHVGGSGGIPQKMFDFGPLKMGIWCNLEDITAP